MIREHIARHGGYEINTEGDSFHIAFSSVAQAVFFAMDTQYRLLETNWPKEVLKLPDCGEVYDKDGLLLMKGPRVRMGIHYAAEGTVAQRQALLSSALSAVFAKRQRKHRKPMSTRYKVSCPVNNALRQSVLENF